MRVLRFLLAGVLLLAAVAALAQAESQVNFVVTGISGQVATSSDGITWTAVPPFPGNTRPIWAVHHNGTHWVASAADSSGGRAWVSADGVTWNQYSTPMTQTTWGGIKHDGTRWVVTGGGGQGATSINGVTWTTNNVPNTGNALGMHVNPAGRWMAMGNAPNVASTSTNGVTWSLVTNPGASMRAAIWDAGVWTVGGTGGQTYRSSNDGASWTPGAIVGSTYDFGTDGMGNFVVVGCGGNLRTSTDLLTWTPRANPFSGVCIYEVEWYGGLWVAVGAGGRVATSPDGITWTLRPFPFTGNNYAIAVRKGPASPVAVDDAFVVNEDQGPQVLNVMGNDANTSGVTLVSYTAPSLGTLDPWGSSLLYTPFADRNGLDSFEYTIEGSLGNSTARVNITINALNDAPQFVVPSSLHFNGNAAQTLAGWATLVRPGPVTATDEATQSITFEVGSNSNPSLFAVQPTIQRTASASATSATPASGAFGVLRFTPNPNVAGGNATVCFRARDNGGTAVGTDSWGVTVPGVDLSPPVCVDFRKNHAPEAYAQASADRAAPGESITFTPCFSDGPCSFDPDGGAVSYFWEFGDGHTSTSATPRHSYARPGTYHVRLTVVDAWGGTAYYTKIITIEWPDGVPVEAEAAGGGVMGLQAHAGEDVHVLEGARVRLEGSQTGGGPATTLEWRQASGLPANLSVAGHVVEFTAPDSVDGKGHLLVFGLRAQDGARTSPLDYVMVHVASRNRAPEARAGFEQSVRAGDLVRLDASGSTDPNADTLSFRWEQVRGGPVTLVDADKPVASFTAPEEPGFLVFRVTASDGVLSADDSVIVVVRPKAPPPRIEVTVRETAGGATLQFTAVGAFHATWTFGDGQQAEGLVVERAFAPGEHTVQLHSDAGEASHSFVVHAAAATSVKAEASSWPFLVAGLLALVGLGLAFWWRSR